ncbi:uncharacterized protein LOC105630320 isoform X2 [Jatropha curcas]|uniref:uncharacterized protein LOC105630320 isoform X2 n=1 Tax=Jatropha curcas TaxID=180498 RepID=UPI001893935B|nr:uncharacterized protein LOC105630320 isoform X2 [Jatropha curcas]
MAVNEIELEEQLKEVGNRLLDPPSSIDDLLNMLDNLECLLINVEQAPSRSMQDALLLPMKALISNALLRNSDADIKVSVASCISEITRITAPDAPYSDDHMKLTVAALEKLSHVSSRCYSKAVSILDTIAKVRSCLVMMDLELDELIVKMFNHFLKTIRSNHPHAVFLAMETIMTLIIDESEDIPVALLTPLLSSVRKENQNVSPVAWKLAEKVITNCSPKLQCYLKEAVQSKGIALDEYSPVVASICQDESRTLEHDHVKGGGDHLVMKGLSLITASPGEVFPAKDGIPKLTSSHGNASTKNSDNIINYSSSKTLENCSLTQNTETADVQGNAEGEVKLEIEPDSNARKRGRKPNSLMNPEEGYDHAWIPAGRKIAKLTRERKPRDKEVHLRSEDPVTNKADLLSAHVTEIMGLAPQTGVVSGASSPSPSQSVPGESHPKRGRAKKIASSMNRDGDSSSLRLSKGQVLNSANEKKARTEDAVNFGKHYEGRSNSQVKQRKRSRKMELTTKTAEETSLPLAHMLPDDKTGSLSEPAEKPLHQSTKIGARNVNKESSLVQIDIRKRSLLSVIPDVDVAKTSSVKKTKSSDRDGSDEEEIPKTNLKRKRTPRKEVPPETPDIGQQLVGRRIKVWWPLDKMFYEGVVDSYDPIRRKHRVLYADGDEEILNLKKQQWKLIGDDIFPDEEDRDTGIPKVDTSFDKPQKGKAKVKSESAKQLRVDLKRSGATSISKRKARTSTRKLAAGKTQDEPSLADKAINDISRPDSNSEGNVQESTGKLKIRGPKASIKSEHTTLETSSSSDGTPKGGNVFRVAAILEEEYSKRPSRNEQESEERSSESTDTN